MQSYKYDEEHGALLPATLHAPRVTAMTTHSPPPIFSPSLEKLGFASFGVTRTPSGIQPVRGGLGESMFSPRHPDSRGCRPQGLSNVISSSWALREFRHLGMFGVQWGVTVTYMHGFQRLSLDKAHFSSDLWDHHVEECYAKDMFTTANAHIFALLKNKI